MRVHECARRVLAVICGNFRGGSLLLVGVGTLLCTWGSTVLAAGGVVGRAS
jgi:hypothetical protein